MNKMTYICPPAFRQGNCVNISASAWLAVDNVMCTAKTDILDLEIGMKNFRRILLKYYFRFLYRISLNEYKEKYPVYLHDLGINISKNHFEGGHGFIHPSSVFDGNDFSLITIGKNTTISADVVFLTHDYSISKGLKMIGASTSGRFLKPITVGKNSFIGMRSILLPGTKIGDNVIIGAGSVVRGEFPDSVIILGNPAKIIGNTNEWAKKHFEIHDFEDVPL